jgi:hypothetical protein
MYKRYRQLCVGKRNNSDLSYGSLFAWRKLNVDDIVKRYHGKWWEIMDRLNDTADISINPDEKVRLYLLMNISSNLTCLNLLTVIERLWSLRRLNVLLKIICCRICYFTAAWLAYNSAVREQYVQGHE